MSKDEWGNVNLGIDYSKKSDKPYTERPREMVNEAAFKGMTGEHVITAGRPQNLTLPASNAAGMFKATSTSGSNAYLKQKK